MEMGVLFFNAADIKFFVDYHFLFNEKCWKPWYLSYYISSKSDAEVTNRYRENWIWRKRFCKVPLIYFVYFMLFLFPVKWVEKLF